MKSIGKKKRRWISLLLIIVVILTTIWYYQNSTNKINPDFSHSKSSNWITINYKGIVNTSTITHTGETVGEVIQMIPTHTEEIKGMVQQYLEPYSILCHDVLLTTINPDTIPLVNILSHFPIGSEQPVWVDLFREGHFQLYYNSNLIRIFLKGDNPQESFNKYKSIVRLPIQDIINSKFTSIENIEVYVFNNDYGKTVIQLNTIPKIINISELNLSTFQKPINLSSIQEFLNQEVTLEAIEVDNNDDLYLYGKQSSMQTLEGVPISISDFAVIYRSIFHYGQNAPYISLDNCEDNRFAKVNFGGHLENTHVGHVVLEADKLFKTLSTGIDANTKEYVKNRITKEIPDFLTEDERSLIEDEEIGHSQIRYWFYPDSIGTVTDGSIGAIMTYRFLADVERMDKNVSTSNAVRHTIEHLNQNFDLYERAENTFKELSAIGRMMALINWLKEMNMNERIDLDELLSVRIPAFYTPTRTRKMLAISSAVYPGKIQLNNENICDFTKTYYISNLLDQYSSVTTDDEFLNIADNYYSKIDISELAPTKYNELSSSLDFYEDQIESLETKINSLKDDIERKKYSVNEYNSREVDQYNNMISRYNTFLESYEYSRNTYNQRIEELNNIDIIQNHIVSIGGGINLAPSEFKKISRDINSSKLQEIKKIKIVLKSDDKIATTEGWMRSKISGNSGAKLNILPNDSWVSSKSINGNFNYKSQANSEDFATVIISSDTKEWQSKTSVNNTDDLVKYSHLTNQLNVKHSNFNREYIGIFSLDGKMIVFQ